MANERNPDDLYRPNRASSNSSNRADDEYRRAARLDTELQADPELAEGPAGTGRIALFAIAVAVVLGVVFYGLNNSTINHAGTSSTAQNSTQSTAPATSRANTNQGTTTGAAPAQPQMPPATAPTQMNRPVNPPADNAPSK
jgi:hypothetical protein